MDTLSYQCGAKPSREDVRDYSVKLLRPATGLPVAFSQSISRNYNQSAGNCVIQTDRNILREIYGIEFGTDMGYGGARSHTMSGLFPNEAANFICKYGLAPAKYDTGEREVMEVIDYYNANKERLHKYAVPYAGTTWGRATSAEQIKAALHSGLFVGACFAISQWNTDKRGVFPCTSAVHGWHEMRVYGWDVLKGEEYALAQNSWGEKWGKNGECLISWEDVLRVGDIIVFTASMKREDDEEKDAVIRRTLRKGMKGEDVKELQTILLVRGYSLGKWGADGSFGDATKTAVKGFQAAHKLKADGVVGAKTWRVLDDVSK